VFAPEDALTRQDAFTFIYRALNALSGIGADELPAGDLAAFSDSRDIAQYALTPTETLVGMGVIEGDGGALLPGDRLTRAQMAKILSLALNYERPVAGGADAPPGIGESGAAESAESGDGTPTGADGGASAPEA
jgi:hypothetical protein